MKKEYVSPVAVVLTFDAPVATATTSGDGKDMNMSWLFG